MATELMTLLPGVLLVFGALVALGVAARWLS